MNKTLRLEDQEQLEQILQRSEENHILLFKHSTRCPISERAYGQLNQFIQREEAKQVEVALVYVVEDRALSNEIASRFEVKHESPQALLIHKNDVIWHTSHGNITDENLANVVKKMIG
ncbi:bacillithiol system redox-active protein YtxJ [Hazenella sp. IB182353]|uniref:bacillithiol system redox-active protein YtxJ n=1 Tax=Polycladospora coralii TaxID=2771432 RepID=UPI001746FD9F|nr:bacillithiol system redox-active protein YtxJ [Polycladospora coralii]MBS7529864.1 bacillithiol system redox-active protein YtxJ [Polycladospora coralii]